MSYDRLAERFAQVSRLNDARSILSWDEATQMPPGSGDSRNQSLAELGALTQALSAAPEIGAWLTDAERGRLDDWPRANVREMRRAYEDATLVPPELNKRLTLARMESEQAWRKLRAANDWPTYRPFLERVLELTRESIGLIARARGLSIYDAALSLYSPGLTTAVVERIFGELKTFLPALTREIVAKQEHEPVVTPVGPYPVAAQRELGREMMAALGFSFDIGRLDVSHHPFCGGTPRDVRITTRYDESEFVSSLMGILHETGHALYEQNLPDAWLGQPIGGAAGMAVHESQSLLHEMQVCRSKEFIQFAAPRVRHHLGAYTRNADSLSADNLARLVTRVAPGLIRVNADEVTYPAHVILRFELERALLEGSLPLAELPAAWNEKMSAYLGLETRGNDADGCMQDVHWPSGAFGYFPAYTFGALIAAQFFAKAKSERPNLTADISRGEFGELRGWLKEKVWSQGARLTTLELVRHVAGELRVADFRRHLETRYLGS